MTGDSGWHVITHEERHRGGYLYALTLRFDEAARIWWDEGEWKAECSTCGEELAAPGPASLAIEIGNHLAGHRSGTTVSEEPLQDRPGGEQDQADNTVEHDE